MIYVWRLLGIHSPLITMLSSCKINAFRIDNWIKHFVAAAKTTRIKHLNERTLCVHLFSNAINRCQAHSILILTPFKWTAIGATSTRIRRKQSKFVSSMLVNSFVLISLAVFRWTEMIFQSTYVEWQKRQPSYDLDNCGKKCQIERLAQKMKKINKINVCMIKILDVHASSVSHSTWAKHTMARSKN